MPVLCRLLGVVFCGLVVLGAGCADQKRTEQPQQSRASDKNAPGPSAPAAAPAHPADGQLDTLAPPAQAEQTEPAPSPVASASVPAHKPAGGARQSAASPGGQVYVVQPKDTLYKIARQFYGSGSKENVDKIMNANRSVLTDPAQLKAGMKLAIPK